VGFAALDYLGPVTFALANVGVAPVRLVVGNSDRGLDMLTLLDLLGVEEKIHCWPDRNSNMAKVAFQRMN
jgi:hypothetical protein